MVLINLWDFISIQLSINASANISYMFIYLSLINLSFFKEPIFLSFFKELTHLDVNVGLYRDDGLTTCAKSSKEVEAIKKEMCKIFKHNSLQITIEANKKVADFLDITLDLRTAIYKPYKKPNSNLIYIYKQRNHQPSIIKDLTKSINKRLSTNSKNAQIFIDTCPSYTEA